MLSTCNRTEVYAVAERFHGAYADIRDFLCELGGLRADELHPHLYSQHDEAAVTHLFEVAAGLDSAVLGESEILGQVRAAWEVAQDEGGAKATLNLLFRHAVDRRQAGPHRDLDRPRHRIGQSRRSRDGHRTARLARRAQSPGRRRRRDGRRRRRRAGQGRRERHHGHQPHAQRGSHLAERIGGHASAVDRIGAAIAATDVLVTCTASGESVVTLDDVAANKRSGAPMLIVDIAVPRSVATPSVTTTA